MDLDRLAVRLRPRSEWEAVDLGFAMIRAWWRPVYSAWLALTLPVALVLIALFGGWGFLAFWWFLPLFEATTLRVLSQTVFGETPPRRQVLRQARDDWPRFIHDATWRRFNPRRSFHMPVTSLEGSSGAQRRARIEILTHHASDVPSWLSLAFLCFGLGLATAFVTAVVVLTPPWLGIDWQLIDQQMDAGEAPWAWKALFLAWAASIILIDPIYTAAGFCLYLNRRTALEGWDLEIAFRSMARRIRLLQSAERRAQRGASVTILTALLLGALLVPKTATAQTQIADGVTDISPEPSDLSPADVIVEIMDREELRSEEEAERWRLRSDIDGFEWNRADDDGDEDAWSFDANFAGLFVAVVGQLFEALLWGGLGLVVLFLFREIWRGAPRFRAPKKKVEVRAPERIAGLDVRRESLPADVAAAAAELWRQGRPLEALGLLYRAALSRLHEEGLELRESFTEADCLSVARRHLTTERSRSFETLTLAWQMAAYAHRLPADETGSQLIDAWRSSFDAPQSPPRPAEVTP